MKIGFIGCGNMATAIINGALENNVISKDNIFVYDTDPQKCTSLNLNICENIPSLISKSDIIFLSIKPNVLRDVISTYDFAHKAVVSIAAGITVITLKEKMPDSRILRIMPNTPLLVGKGVSCFEQPSTLNKEEYDFIYSLFSKLGVVESIPYNLMDEITAISGSGPAYVYMFIDALATAGVSMGIPKQTAYNIALNTFIGGAEMLVKTKKEPKELIENVCSPGGTTLQAMQVFEEKDTYAIIKEAVNACANKSKELSNA